MKDFADKTAVITGAGSGLGRAFALEAGSRGMRVVLADINTADLQAVQAELEAASVVVHVVTTDVSQLEAIERLAFETEQRFGKVHVLFNNAGVSSAPMPIWESSLDDWEWVLGVNLKSIIYGVKVFVPRMLAHGEAGHIINTASIAGLTNNSRMNTYAVTKHAAVAFSETLQMDLIEADARLRASVLCPAWVKTQIHRSERNRNVGERTSAEDLDVRSQQTAMQIGQLVEHGLEASEVAQTVFQAIEKEQFYILTHAPFNKLILKRMSTIVEQGQPSASW